MNKLVCALSLLALTGCGNKAPEDKPKAQIQPVASAPAPKVEAPTTTPESKPAPAAALLPPLNSEKQILHDPRIPLPKKTEFSAQEKEKVLGLVFPKYKKKRDDCVKPEPGAKSSEDDIAAGEIAPELESMAKGSFMAPNEELTAYVIDVGECNADWTRDSPDTTALVVFVKDNQIKYKGSFNHHNHLKTADLDQNGTHELIGIDEGSEIDEYQYLTAYRFNGKDLEPIGDTSRTTLTDVCAIAEHTDGDEGTIRISVMSYVTKERGKIPEIQEEKLVARCKTPTKFEPDKE